MASRPDGYGLTAEIKNKLNDKYDANLERDAIKWIQQLVPSANLRGVSGAEKVHEALKDGVILCQLMEVLQPGSFRQINKSKMAFKQMENIGSFLDATYRYGCAKNDMFQTVDLFEAQNMPQVILGITALGRKASSKGRQGIGPKESAKNQRNFSAAQVKAGRDGHIGLQMGSNKGATQAGQNFGKNRAILD